MANISRRKLFGWLGLGAGAAASSALPAVTTAATPKVVERAPVEGEARLVFSHMETPPTHGISMYGMMSWGHHVTDPGHTHSPNLSGRRITGVTGAHAYNVVEVYKTERWDGAGWVLMGWSRMFPTGMA